MYKHYAVWNTKIKIKDTYYGQREGFSDGFCEGLSSFSK